MGIEQGEHDDVELLLAFFQVASRIVDHHLHSRGAVRFLEMKSRPNRWMSGSISTATTRCAPFRTAAATSFPVPAPSTKTEGGFGKNRYGML